MTEKIITKKILKWYDLNKRNLPWRKKVPSYKKHYYTLVSEFMLQQTQVVTVIPFFNRFIKKLPNLVDLAKVKENELIKLWEGLGYYSRVKNLQKTAKIIICKYHGKIPNNYEDLISLPGIGSYTANAILAIAFNKSYIPLDGNVERVLKRYLFLKSEKDIKKEKLIKKKSVFGTSSRSSDYAQALMELGSLICKPSGPLCNNCPIYNKCASFKLKDFKILKKIKSNKVKYFKADIYYGKEKTFLIKNNKFNFLKNLLIFPMNEIKAIEYNSSKSKKFQIKISNINMKILIKLFLYS